MSHEAMSWAWELDLPSSKKFLVLALSNYADQEASCYPGHERLASMTGLSVRSVGRNLRELEAMGVFSRERRARRNGSGRTSDRYYLDLSWKPEESGNQTECPDETNQTKRQVEERFNRTNDAVSTGHHVGGTIREPLEPINHKTPYKSPTAEPEQGELAIVAEPAPPAGGGSKSKSDGYPPQFEEFWKVYPKKADKRAALKAWRAAKKRTVVADSELLGAAMKYRDDPNREDQFTKNPATWLNKGSWENGPLPARNGNNRAQERLKNNLGVVEYFAEQEQATGNYWGELER